MTLHSMGEFGKSVPKGSVTPETIAYNNTYIQNRSHPASSGQLIWVAMMG